MKRRNWWRDLVTSTWRDAYDAWWSRMEAATSLYPTEVAEYRRDYPPPTLKATMIGLSQNGIAS